MLLTNQKMLLNVKDQMEKYKKEIEELRGEIYKMKKHTNASLEDLQNNKADKNDLAVLESNNNQKLEEIVRQIMDLMPSKDELKKKFTSINNRLKLIEQQMMTKTNTLSLLDDDAMITKKKIDNLKCASCDKNISNLNAMAPNPYNWKKMPQRNEPDRIANYGQGYSWFLKNLES